jgi:hypothetical protein
MRSTIFDSGPWAGVDNAWEQDAKRGDRKASYMPILNDCPKVCYLHAFKLDVAI